MIQGDHFNLTSISKNSILTILEATEVSKAAGLDSLSECFLKDGAKCLAKAISHLCNSLITSEKFPDSVKYRNLNLFIRKVL